MIQKQPLGSQQVRRISASFAFIKHRFLQDDFWQTLDYHEQLRYLFLVIVADGDWGNIILLVSVNSLLRACLAKMDALERLKRCWSKPSMIISYG